MNVVLDHDGDVGCALIHGDCLDVLKQLSPESVDSVVTDPPAGISFMGKEWDGAKGGRREWIAWLSSVMSECLRVLKPGGHALVWALPRTSHWTATAIEDAGFKVIDVITHHFGSGFPKSANVSKLIDKKLGATREVIGSVSRPAFSKGRGHGRGEDGRPVYRGVNGGHEGTTTLEISAPGSEEAVRWDGFGTALKPASEHWVLARKPLAGTVVENVLKHGTGALNIDATRIGTSGGTKRAGQVPYPLTSEGKEDRTAWARTGHDVLKIDEGRWPANLVFTHSEACEDAACADDCPVGALDRQSGVRKSGARKAGVRTGLGFHGAAGDGGPAISPSAGGASRFFYQSKAPRREKEAGLDALPVRPKDTVYGDGMNSDTKVRTEEQAENGVDRGGAKNIHPTVKSIALMRWLCRLVTPPGGIVLDPFAGSGTTGIAAQAEGFSFIGIEREVEYVEIAQARLEHALATILTSTS